jgi:hypothetical protein
VRTAHHHPGTDRTPRADGAHGREDGGAGRAEPQRSGHEQRDHEGQRRRAARVTAREREPAVMAHGPVDQRLAEGGDQSGEPRAGHRQHRRPRSAGEEADHRDRHGGHDHHRRGPEDGHRTGDVVAGQRVDRAVEMPVDPAGRRIPCVVEREDGEDRRGEHRDGSGRSA